MTPGTDPELYFAEDGAPRSGRFGDIYYSLQDGLAESKAVFLGGCHLPEAWSGQSAFSVMELGFGTGLNIAALIQLWRTTRTPGTHLHIFSIEGFLMTAADARQSLSAWPELAEITDALLGQWPKARTGFSYMDFPDWGVSLTLALMDVREALTTREGQVDAIFLDGFSPALNSDMWADDVLALVAQKARAGTRLATFTVAGFVRRGLQAAGFAVAKMPGFGRKRERLEAIFTIAGDARAESPSMPGKLAIIGAGIAGCALAYQARLMGIIVDIFDASGVGSGASGNIAALMTPRLDAGDNEISALFADAFAYAGSLYRGLCPGAILGEGVQQCEMTPKDASRFARIVKQAGFAMGDLRLFALGESADMPSATGITLATALWVSPNMVLQALLGDAPVIARAFHMFEDGCVVTSDGERLDGYDAVIIACGEGIFDLADYQARYDLRAVRGQVEIVASEQPLESALSWGGYAVPLGDGFVFGATHERDDRGSDVRDADRARNLASLAVAMPERADAAADGPFQSRASVRVMTRDYLPVVGRLGESIYALTGLGARGFCLAPLLAKALLTQIVNAPSPLPRVATRLLRPDRLLGNSLVPPEGVTAVE